MVIFDHDGLSNTEDCFQFEIFENFKIFPKSFKKWFEWWRKRIEIEISPIFQPIIVGLIHLVRNETGRDVKSTDSTKE